ncbi:uncharacterized protein LOC130228337, partial [Danio aesculapii]|uniref:uncharacterized protein LOC130228337 n=1 Tax=Danio aesculapii TaxID=1142201 RepID=UPI0024BF8F2D
IVSNNTAQLTCDLFPSFFSLTDDFQLVIPEKGERVKINHGPALVVSCHLSPTISAADMDITWYSETSVVCAYKNREMTQGVGYEERANLFIHDLMRGNVSLRVANFTESDLGVYMCQVTSQNKTQQITVNVAEEGKHFITPLRILCTFEDISCVSPSFSSTDFELVFPQTTKEAKVSLGSELTIFCYSSPEICATAMQIRWFKVTDCVCVYKNTQIIKGRGYKDRVSLDTGELERGNVSVHLRNFSISDVGDYHCQVSSGGRTQHINVGGEHSLLYQICYLLLEQEIFYFSVTISFTLQTDKIWTEEETNKMDESALMAEINVNNVQELYRKLIRAYNKRN